MENQFDCFAETAARYGGSGKKACRSISELPPEERPRERLLEKGPAFLSDTELLAIILNTGIRGKNVSVLAGELLGLLDRNKEMTR